jgi:hypothetical protein
VSYQRETESPDERRHRQLRARRTLLVVAAVAAAVIVPLGIHVRHSWDAWGPVDGSTGLPSTSEPSPSAADEEGLAVDPEQPELYPLAADATALAKAVEARGNTVTLTAPPRPFACPADTGAMSTALGVPLDYAGGTLTDYPDRCRWTAGPSDGPDHLSVGVGFYADWTEADLDDVSSGEDCWRTPVEAFAPAAVLEACLLGDNGTYWTLFVADDGEAGIWTLFAAAGDHQPVTGPAALTALVDLADSTW